MRLLLLLAALQAVPPEDPASAVHPRKFGTPGGVGETRGWYVWHSFDAEKWTADVSREQGGEHYTVRVLPWTTSYRQLAYPGHPDELRPGERVNLFFNPEGAVKRAYLVHFQDELGQMKGHGHYWSVEETGDRVFKARGMSADKPLDPAAFEFTLDPAVVCRRGGKTVVDPALAKDDRLYLSWCYEGSKRVVKLLADAASLDAIKAGAEQRARDRVAKEGMAGFVDGDASLLIFPNYWSQASALKPGQKLRIQATDAAYQATGPAAEATVVSRKNVGAYGSGCTEVAVKDAPADVLRGWTGGKVVRIFAAAP
ncbi:MAG TPA: hypothetical protein VE981_15330 [Planctomycetota bacterium]|nr:hypothetical protein [Planctomycetota bacterium]